MKSIYQFNCWLPSPTSQCRLVFMSYKRLGMRQRPVRGWGGWISWVSFFRLGLLRYILGNGTQRKTRDFQLAMFVSIQNLARGMHHLYSYSLIAYVFLMVISQELYQGPEFSFGPRHDQVDDLSWVLDFSNKSVKAVVIFSHSFFGPKTSRNFERFQKVSALRLRAATDISRSNRFSDSWWDCSTYCNTLEHYNGWKLNVSTLVLFINSNASLAGRIAITNEMMGVPRVHCFGLCMHE